LTVETSDMWYFRPFAIKVNEQGINASPPSAASTRGFVTRPSSFVA